jgi:hypothetical protein
MAAKFSFGTASRSFIAGGRYPLTAKSGREGPGNPFFSVSAGVPRVSKSHRRQKQTPKPSDSRRSIKTLGGSARREQETSQNIRNRQLRRNNLGVRTRLVEPVLGDMSSNST